MVKILPFQGNVGGSTPPESTMRLKMFYNFIKKVTFFLYYINISTFSQGNVGGSTPPKNNMLLRMTLCIVLGIMILEIMILIMVKILILKKDSI
jgi:hypothetical protein